MFAKKFWISCAAFNRISPMETWYFNQHSVINIQMRSCPSKKCVGVILRLINKTESLHTINMVPPCLKRKDILTSLIGHSGQLDCRACRSLLLVISHWTIDIIINNFCYTETRTGYVGPETYVQMGPVTCRMIINSAWLTWMMILFGMPRR